MMVSSLLTDMLQMFGHVSWWLLALDCVVSFIFGLDLQLLYETCICMSEVLRKAERETDLSALR